MRKICILFLIIVFPTISFAQNDEITWDYPVKPGTKEWKNLKTYQERLDAYNIPQHILKTITTEELVKTCLKYPEFRLIFTRNSLQQGYNYIRTKFNGFKELELRIDAGHELLKVYKNYKPENINNKSSTLKKGRHVLKFTYIEILLANNNILKNLNAKTSQELLTECLKKYKKKKDKQSTYSIIGLETTVLIIARIQKENLTKNNSKFDNEVFNLFVHNGILINPQILDEIVIESEKI